MKEQVKMVAISQKILVFGVPFIGHSLPLFKLVDSCLNESRIVYYCNTKEFTKKFPKGWLFQSYPLVKGLSQVDNSNRGFKELPEDLLLCLKNLFLWSKRLIEKIRPDIVVFDSMAIWGYFSAREYNIPVICSQTWVAMTNKALQFMGLHDNWFKSDTYRKAVKYIDYLNTVYNLKISSPEEVFTTVQNKADYTILYTAKEFQFDDQVEIEGKTVYIGNRIDDERYR